MTISFLFLKKEIALLCVFAQHPKQIENSITETKHTKSMINNTLLAKQLAEAPKIGGKYIITQTKFNAIKKTIIETLLI